MPERSNGTVSKTVVPFRVPRVRIPVFPLNELQVIDLQLVALYERSVIAKRFRSAEAKEWVKPEFFCKFAIKE